VAAKLARPKPNWEQEPNPLWYKDAVIYELHVKTFHDSDGDGIGDFKGLTQKLDYLQDLGVTAIWLLPFYPSPLRDDGYDIGDYMSVHPSYGTLRDFQTFLREAHRRGLRVITELVINHTSDQHEWFKRARRAAPGSRWRNFYVWSDTPERYRGVRTIFKDFEPSNWAWDGVAGAYYWHRFFSHQPDLNFRSRDVKRAIRRVLDFWLGMGVDGLRLDAVPYLFEREGTSCENLPETHAYLAELRRYVDEHYKDRMLLGEANQWPEDAVAYFGDGDECHMAFHFPLMPRLFMAVRMEDRYPIIEILRETPRIPETSQWALFLRNHDELTLEMVTDEDRDYMYRAYAQDAEARINLGIRRRLAPLLGNHRRTIELMVALLLSLPGTPVIYYGDEIGMGDNIYLGDRDGVRTPMQWSSDRNTGFSRANPQRLYLPVIIDPEYHYETVNVESQNNNPHSLLWWTKRVIAIRKRYPAFGRGSIEFLYPENAKVLAFFRRDGDQTLLVVANLSRFVQGVSLDLGEFQGSEPVEIFGSTRFPPVTADPYFLSLGPHSFYWFTLAPQAVETLAPAAAPDATRAALRVAGTWDNALRGRARAGLEALLPDYIRPRRWFGSKARTVRGVEIGDILPVRLGRTTRGYLALLEVSYAAGERETYVLPIAFAAGERAEELVREAPQAAIARIELRDGTTGILYDACWDDDFCRGLLETIGRRREVAGEAGTLQATATAALRRLRGSRQAELSPSRLGADQSNTSVVYGERLILKLFRRPDEGMNPDLEIGRFLTERAALATTPSVAGYIEYRRGRGQLRTLAILHGLVANEGDAWRYTLDELGRYYERALAIRPVSGEAPRPDGSIAELLAEAERPDDGPPLPGEEVVGAYLESARLLGRRTGELHVALASAPDDPEFAPEPFTPFFQRSLLQSMRGQSRLVFQLLRRQLGSIASADRALAESVLQLEDEVNARFQAVLSETISATRIRVHGDYHLGQVLFTGSDFVIIDFEGEPARPLSERRVKRSPLRDVAGMLRSFHYAAYAALYQREDIRPGDLPALEPWAQFWQARVSSAFLASYLETTASAAFLPPDARSRGALIEVYLLDKVLYELAYELNNRPDWLHIPLVGLTELVRAGRDG
jgi:maltose alpha-D-glucosyltransferase/alpha-amylase